MGIRIAAIGDAHASGAWIAQVKNIRPIADKIIFTGDIFDRGWHARKVFDTVKTLTEQKVMVPLWGNHCFMLAAGMSGSDKIMRDWMINGARPTLENFGIRFIKGCVNGNPWDSNNFSPYHFRRIRQSEELNNISSWMIDNLKLYYIDDYGTLYVHAGVPLFYDGRIALTYNGASGIGAMDLMEKDMEQAILSRDTEHPVLKLLNNEEMSPLWTRWWIEIAKKRGPEMILDGLSKTCDRQITGIVFGHDAQERILNIGNKIFGIDCGVWTEKGAYATYYRDDNGILLVSSTDGKNITTERISNNI